MRPLLILVLVLAGCRAPYMSDYADMTTSPDEMPQVGTSKADLDDWFRTTGYAPGPRVQQSEAELMRSPGDPLSYSLMADKRWWFSQSRAIRDLCVTQKIIYYRLDDSGALKQAIQTKRSQC